VCDLDFDPNNEVTGSYLNIKRPQSKIFAKYSDVATAKKGDYFQYASSQLEKFRENATASISRKKV